MFTCADCTHNYCQTGEFDKAPRNCPCRLEDRADFASLYTDATEKELAKQAACVEQGNYLKGTRVEETMDYARRLGVKKLGVAFCLGLKAEAKILCDILRSNGFEVESVCCKSCGLDKSVIDVPAESRFDGGEGFEAMCNPIGQAELLGRAGTELNILVGLCVGHDTLFLRHTQAPATVLVAKDRVLGHNPVAALYGAGYYRKGVYEYMKKWKEK